MPPKRCALPLYPFPHPFSLQLGSVSCQVANALSYPSQEASLKVVWGQIASRANGTSCRIKPSWLGIRFKNQSTGLKGGGKHLFTQKDYLLVDSEAIRRWGEFHLSVFFFFRFVAVTSHRTSRNPFRICLAVENIVLKLTEHITDNTVSLMQHGSS